MTGTFYRATIFYLCCAVFLGSCKKEKPSDHTIKSQTSHEKGFLDSKYNPYLLLMNDQQRAHFFKLSSDLHRDRFLQAQGIKQKKVLQQTLQEGMSTQDVLKILGNPIVTERNKDIIEDETRWIYKEFNGYRNIQYAIIFQNDKLTHWKLWLN